MLTRLLCAIGVHDWEVGDSVDGAFGKVLWLERCACCKLRRIGYYKQSTTGRGNGGYDYGKDALMWYFQTRKINEEAR